MCGIAVIAAEHARDRIGPMTSSLSHRGPDASSEWIDDAVPIALGHRRLSIIDLSDAGRQPMVDASGRYVLVFNGEIYNYKELRQELADYPFRSQSDSEVVLAAWARWGQACLDRMLGMFAFAIWDRVERQLVAVRDRFGVKPLYVATLEGGGIALGSEIKALHEAGVPAEPNLTTWATYLARGTSDHDGVTFWNGIAAVPAGSILRWQRGGKPVISRWYDLVDRTGLDLDERTNEVVAEEYLALLRDSVKLRFRADVPVGINLSGGLDSSLLLGLVQLVQGPSSDVKAFTFVTGDERYDELPWVKLMLDQTRHPLVSVLTTASDIPMLADHISAIADEPFGGIPTLAYANLFRHARKEGVIVLLDGQGLDEQWAGYDYYRARGAAPVVQGSVDRATRPECMDPEFAALVDETPSSSPFPDRLRNLQLRDVSVTKIPRALRYNDRVSMAASTELREPFLDHRLVELAFRQPERRKIADGIGKVMAREIAAQIVPEQVRSAPKRAVQTPQREWLRGPLAAWASERIESALTKTGWFVPSAGSAWTDYLAGQGDNSHWVWQWISVAMLVAR